ncbi:hypothetical protein LSH36_422g02013 [Paralvinella palmiformis]|uniref:protein-tyrosine-phosphatase n=1 Tax=Paralvinella palmiformis TaxID=53620 RepID=A0AAD9JD45_9ANNE|nr:hypothetical protein LSH36_422g02013 [Paralvinella palmiformis]
MNQLEEEFNYYDETAAWNQVYQKIRQDSLLKHDFSVKDAKRPEYKERNRYRDVSPYDHSRVRLERNHLDYINASLVEYPEANRSYILTQGPLPKTSSHFWLMVWEQNSAAVLMLNRVVEMGRIKCHQYFPMNVNDEDDLVFEDVGLRVSYVSEEDKNFFVIRTLDIEDLQTGQKKRVLQFHYTTWPDFGVPESPEAFLNFLFAVRKAGVLEQSVGPPVIHCSAGIGRSGTFCLVDTCLILIEKNQDVNSVNVCDVLMEMRQYRMGLIQTADQLRFSYMAVIEGCKHVLSTSTVDSGIDNGAICQSSDDDVTYTHLNQDEDDLDADNIVKSPDLITSTLSPSDNNNPPITKVECNNQVVQPSGGHQISQIYSDENTKQYDHMIETTNITDNLSNEQLMEMDHLRQREQSGEIRRRAREERKKKTAEQIAKMKQKQRECEKLKLRRKRMTPLLWGASVAVLVASYVMYKCYIT